jgi:hypothetical protein
MKSWFVWSHDLSASRESRGMPGKPPLAASQYLTSEEIFQHQLDGKQLRSTNFSLEG